MTVLRKLHIQLAHCPPIQLKRLINAAGHGVCDSQFENIQRTCDIRRMNPGKQTKPVVGLPHATEFNQCVAMDLHYIDSK